MRRNSRRMTEEEMRERVEMARVVSAVAFAVWFTCVGYLLGMLVWRW